MILSYPNLNKNSANWLTQLGPAINNPVSVDFIGSNLPDGRLKTTNIARQPNAGGLITWKQTPSAIPNLSYAKLSTLVMVPGTSIANLNNLETDFIMVLTGAVGGVPIPQKFNGSTRWNSKTGFFEIDASASQPAWTSINAGPGAIIPDIPHQLSILYQYDLTKLTTTIISITWDAVVYPVGTTTGVQTDAWAKVLAIQLQDACIQPGSAEVVYDQTTLSLADQPLT